MKMNIRPSFRFQFTDLLKTSLGFLAVMVALMIIVPIISLHTLNNADVWVSLSGYGAIAAIFLFVIGIVAPRSFFRLDVQLGVSRGTSFTAQLLALVAVSAALAVVGELWSFVAGLVLPASERLVFADLYQLMYMGGGAMTLGGHLLSFCFNISLGVCGYICGMLFTVLFWRLNKFWIVVSVLVMVGLSIVLTNLSWIIPQTSWLCRLFEAFGAACEKGPLALILLFLILSGVLALIEWLILRRAFIKASK